MLIPVGYSHAFHVYSILTGGSVGLVCEWHRGTYDVFRVCVYIQMTDEYNIPELMWKHVTGCVHAKISRYRYVY